LIYFNINKQAYAQEINNYIAKVEDVIWQKHCAHPAGYTWDIIDNNFVDLTKTEAWQTKQFEIAKAEKIAENETKRNVEYIATSIGQLKTQTPLGDLKTAIPLFDKIAAANGSLPAGAVRLYDNEGNVTLSPVLTLEQYQALTVEVAMAYVAIDTKSTAYTQAIMQAQDMEELEAIVIDYTTSAQEETEGEEGEAPNATDAGTSGGGF